MKLRIKEIIRARKIKQKELAKILGMTTTGFNLIVNNKTTPSMETLERIAKTLDVPISHLLEEKRTRKFSAIINDDGKAYEASSPEQLRFIASTL